MNLVLCAVLLDMKFRVLLEKAFVFPVDSAVDTVLSMTRHHKWKGLVQHSSRRNQEKSGHDPS